MIKEQDKLDTNWNKDDAWLDHAKGEIKSKSTREFLTHCIWPPPTIGGCTKVAT